MSAFVSFVFSQETRPDKSQAESSNVLDKITLRFDVEALPAPEAVGFDDPKSKWKMEYELRLSDAKTISGLHLGAYANCQQNTPGYQKCVGKVNRKLNKIYKKTALFITKGKFQKAPLSSEANRTINFPVELTPDAISIFNKSLESIDNPTFILIVKGKVSSKTSGGMKIKYRPSVTFQYPLKLVKKDGSFDFYNITIMGATVRITNENNKIIYGIFRN